MATRKPKSPAPKKRTTRTPEPCNHKLDKYVWRGDNAVARVCAVPQSDGVFGCGAVLSLGESNDEPFEVQIEMRAVDLESAERAGEWTEVAEEFEVEGWLDLGEGLAAAGTDLGSCAGWLARQIYPVHVDHFPEALAGEDWPVELVARIAPTHPAIAAALKLRQAKQEAARAAELDAMEYEVTRDAEPDPRDEEPGVLDGIDQADPAPPHEIDLPHPAAVADDMADAARTLNAELAAGASDQPPRSWPPHTGCDPDSVDADVARPGEGCEGAEP
jgi:hypothetical protein